MAIADEASASDPRTGWVCAGTLGFDSGVARLATVVVTKARYAGSWACSNGMVSTRASGLRRWMRTRPQAPPIGCISESFRLSY